MSSVITELLVAPCTREAAAHAVRSWHYSHAMPVGKLMHYGAWEDGRYLGAVVFGRGVTPQLGKAYGLEQTEWCELTRVALRDHNVTVTTVLARCLAQLKTTVPNMRMVISFADPAVGHHGGIYQAGNWIYSGITAETIEVLWQGKWVHDRVTRSTGWGTLPAPARQSAEAIRNLPRRSRPGKYRYLMALDKAMRRRMSSLALPYPPAVKGSTVSR